MPRRGSGHISSAIFTLRNRGPSTSTCSGLKNCSTPAAAEPAFMTTEAYFRHAREGLHCGGASFETRLVGAPQDGAAPLTALRKSLILRRTRGGRLEGRASSAWHRSLHGRL